MSKVAQEIRWVRGTQRKPVDQPISLMYVESELNQGRSGSVADEFRMGLTFQVRLFVSEQEWEKYREELVRNASRQIVEEVFGEFRDPIRAIELAVWERDWSKATEAIQRLRTQMWED